MEIEVPRDRDTSFGPQVMRKRQWRPDGISQPYESLHTGARADATLNTPAQCGPDAHDRASEAALIIQICARYALCGHALVDVQNGGYLRAGADQR